MDFSQQHLVIRQKLLTAEEALALYFDVQRLPGDTLSSLVLNKTPSQRYGLFRRATPGDPNIYYGFAPISAANVIQVPIDFCVSLQSLLQKIGLPSGHGVNYTDLFDRYIEWDTEEQPTRCRALPQKTGPELEL